jgi:hypothetical protein
MERPGRRDRQRPARHCRNPCPHPARLPDGQPLPRNGLQQLQLGVIVRGTDVLDLPRPAMAGVVTSGRCGFAGLLARLTLPQGEA